MTSKKDITVWTNTLPAQHTLLKDYSKKLSRRGSGGRYQTVRWSGMNEPDLKLSSQISWLEKMGGQWKEKRKKEKNFSPNQVLSSWTVSTWKILETRE